MDITLAKNVTNITSKEYIDAKLIDKADKVNVYTKEEINNTFVTNETLENSITSISEEELNNILK